MLGRELLIKEIIGQQAFQLCSNAALKSYDAKLTTRRAKQLKIRLEKLKNELNKTP